MLMSYMHDSVCQVLGLTHPAIDTRDTSLFLPFRRSLKSKSNHILPLATLVNKLMGRTIGQQGNVPVQVPMQSVSRY